MSDDAIIREKHGKTSNLVAPRWMSRTEKVSFRRILDARNALSNPVLAAEYDLLCDYVAVRTRIAELRRVAKAALAACKPRYRDEIGDGNPEQQRHAAAMARQLDGSTAFARRLARELKLTNHPEKGTGK